jgi:type II secretory pathway component PulK
MIRLLHETSATSGSGVGPFAAYPRPGMPVRTRCRMHGGLHCRGGFALLSVLWVLVGVAALALAANLAARDGVASARNRADLARAAWRAEGCLERARAAIHDALLAHRNEGAAPTVWGRMDREIAQSTLLRGSGCDLEMRAAGAALDVNAADDETLRRLLLAIGRPSAQADSLVDALADWRDEDDAPRPFGAERAAYRAVGMRGPRNGPLADPRELGLVRGWSAVPGADTLLGTETGRVPVTHAPPAVLAALPGLGPEAAARVAEMRLRDEPITDLGSLLGTLGPGAQDRMRGFADLAGAVVLEPEAWIVTARGAVGAPPAVSVVEVRLVRAEERAAVVRRRTWTE